MNQVLRLLLLFCALPLLAKPQAAVFSVTYNAGFTPQAEAAFEYATHRWSQVLESNVPIKVHANMIPMLPGMLGITFPNGRKDFIGAPVANTWYATSLANSLAGIELNPGEADIDVYLNQTVTWFYDTVGTVPAGQYDFASVAMHELAHGLGFVSLAKKNGTEGSFGMLEASDFAPLVSSFSWPNLDTLPGAFDRFLVNNTNASLLDFPNPSAALGTAVANNNVYFIGPNAMAANGGIKPRVFAPAAFELGSSISHLNEATYPTGNPNEMMTPNGTPGNANHDPGPITIGVLRDIGWNLNPALSVNGVSLQRDVVVYPNPAQNALVVSCHEPFEPNHSLKIFNALGQTVLTLNDFHGSETIDISMLKPGCYSIVLEGTHVISRAHFVKP